MRLLSLFLLLVMFRVALAQPAELHVGLWIAAGQDKTRPVENPMHFGVRAFNEELAREICRRISARCIMENSFFAEILPGIEAGRLDLGFGNYLRTPERERRVAFSDAIWNSSSRLLGTVEGNRRLTARTGQAIRLDRLHAVRIAAVNGTQQVFFLERRAGAQQLTVVQGKSLREVIDLVRDGKADLCLVPMLTAYDSLQDELPGRFEFVGPPLVDDGLGGSVHIALPRHKDALRHSVNKAIAAMRADGSYHRLFYRHFPFNLD